MYSTVIISYLLIALVIAAAATTNEVQATSLIGAYSKGYDDGKDEGAEDTIDDNGHNSQCPQGSGLTYCTGYKIGYEVGYVSGNTIQ